MRTVPDGTRVTVCPWDTLGKPRIYVVSAVWDALLELLPTALTPDALIVDVPGVGPTYVVEERPIPIYDPDTKELLGQLRGYSA